MQKIIKGSCHCGNVKIKISGPVYGFKHCHCTTCRKLHGTVYASNAIVSKKDFEMICGADGLHSYNTSPRKTIYFCKNCCSPIYSAMPENPQEIYIRLGLLDDDPGVRAEYHWWVDQKAPWYEILDDLPQVSTTK